MVPCLFLPALSLQVHLLRLLMHYAILRTAFFIIFISARQYRKGCSQ